MYPTTIMQTGPFTLTAAFTALLATAQGHMIMKNPKPFGSNNKQHPLDNSPLTGANYPCKLAGSPDEWYNKEGLDNKMAIGETQTLSFTGSAVHGGGSCQLAITKDPQPSKSTSWQVILSIEGGCPSKDGNGASTYDFKIPDSVAPGDYVFTWTWISKMSGTQEYYQNCAPITVTGSGGSAKRSANETMDLLPREEAFPELFVANLEGVNTCKTTLSSDVKFPFPGPNVEKPGSKNQFAGVSGKNCVPVGQKEGPVAGGASGGSSSGSDSGSGSGDEGSSSSTATKNVVTSGASAPTSMASTLVTSTLAATTTAAIIASSSSSAAASPSAAPASGGGMSGACSTEGVFNCIGGSSYQQCASGKWTAAQAMPASTKCKDGQSTTLWGRDGRSMRLRRAN
ncbi:hypothetical protein F4780DRAFT_731447 [Xylariomycetidae sp. FL0641]|nr:hypothetical protein F4780DRAFT_731447 [Xylariomycetidae sp. FL0641]